VIYLGPEVALEARVPLPAPLKVSLHSTEGQLWETRVTSLWRYRELLKNGVKPGQEPFQLLQCTPTLWGLVLTLYGTRRRGLRIRDEVLVVFFTTLPSCAARSTPAMTKGAQFAAWARMKAIADPVTRLCRGSWCWVPMEHLPAGQLEVITSDLLTQNFSVQPPVL